MYSQNKHDSHDEPDQANEEFEDQEFSLPYSDPVIPSTCGADVNMELVLTHNAMDDTNVLMLPDPYPDIPEVYYG